MINSSNRRIRDYKYSVLKDVCVEEDKEVKRIMARKETRVTRRLFAAANVKVFIKNNSF